MTAPGIFVTAAINALAIEERPQGSPLEPTFRPYVPGETRV
jgi:hypothetical protein